jgi:hypothetical protein
MRLSLAELKLIIIDEISMLSNMGLPHIHQRLKEIFVTPNSELFAGISILVFGDFFSYHQFEAQQYFQIIRMLHLICVIHGMSSKWLN